MVELLPINPDMVVPKLNDDWTVQYTVSFRSGTRVLTQDEIWHVRLFTLDGLNGLNPISYARQALGLGQAMDTHAAKLFTNGAVTSGVLQTAQELTDEAFTRLKTEFQGEHMGVANAYKPMILEMGLEWKPISLNARIPVHRIQEDDRGADLRLVSRAATSCGQHGKDDAQQH
ncbi:phage portal protein [Pseudomonas sp. PCH446]